MRATREAEGDLRLHQESVIPVGETRLFALALGAIQTVLWILTVKWFIQARAWPATCAGGSPGAYRPLLAEVLPDLLRPRGRYAGCR